MIYPEIFDGYIMGFFTDREVGLDIEGLTHRHTYYPVQEHTGRVMVLRKDLKPKVADAVITDRHDILLGVHVSDCVPILLCDMSGRSIGVIHAGWRGTADGILKKTIRKMQDTFGTRAGDILIAMGPAIRWCCYLVDRDVYDAVAKETGEGEYSMQMDDKICLDLQSANRQQALSSGVRRENISIVEECTFCYPEKYYSYRYMKLNGKGRAVKNGRQGGFIGFP